MARTIGEGFVRIRPDTSGFGPEAERSLSSTMQRAVSRVDGLLAKIEPIAAAAGAAAGRRYSSGVERETSRLSQILSGLFRVGGAVALGGGLAYAAAQAVALTSAIVPAVGAIGILPGVAVTAAAGLGVLALATSNLGDALAESTGGGGGGGGGARAAAAAYEAAQKRIATATREAARAARDLIAVRKQEAEQQQQLKDDVEGASLAVERATAAEEEAAAALEKAKKSKDPKLIKDADLAQREAAFTLKEAKHRYEELSAAQAEAARTGVDGSEAVQDAMQRQRDSQAELTAAQKEATNVGGTAAAGAVSKQAAAYAKLSPAARSLVDTIKALRPAWEAAQRSIQQRVWAGVSGDVRSLSGAYLPVLTRRLGDVGSAWNTAIRQSAKLATSKAFVRDVDTTLGNTAKTSNRLAQAVAPIVNILRNVGVVGSGYLPGLADQVLRLVQRFDRWVASARETGKLGEWIGNGIGVLRQLGTIAGNVVGIIVALLRAGGAEAGGDMLSGLVVGTTRLRAFLNSAEGQERISDVLTTVRNVAESVVSVLPRLVDNAAKLGPVMSQAAGEGGALRDALGVTDVVVGFLADHIDLLTKALPLLAAGFVVSKVAQTGANLAAIASLPIKAADVAASWGMRSAMQAHTAALVQNTAASRLAAGTQAAETAATNGGMLARSRAVASAIGMRVATLAGAAATGIATAAQWALNIAMSPLGLIIIAIVAAIALLVLGILWLWNNNEGFRKFVIAAWQAIWGVIKGVVDWLVNVAWPFIAKAFGAWLGLVKNVYGWVFEWLGKIVSFVWSLPGKIASAARGLFDGIVAAAKGGINKVIEMWNRLDFSLNIKVPDWVPGVGGKGFSIPDLFPDIPRLAEGGVARARPGGILANIGEGGEDEAVAPVSTLKTMIRDAVRDAGGGRGVNVEHLEVKAFSDRFSLTQVQEDLVMHGVH